MLNPRRNWIDFWEIEFS